VLVTVTATALTVLLIVLTFLPLSRAEVWWVRGGDFPRLQFFGFGLLLVIAELFLLDWARPESWVLIALATACVLWQAWWIWPYTFLHGKEVRDAADTGQDHRIRILIANVLMTNRDAPRLLEIIRATQPDVVAAVETDQWWEAQLAAIESDYRYTLKCPKDNKYGMHLYSRLPLDDAQICFLTESDYPSVHALVTLRSGERIQLHCLHPAPPSPSEKESSEQRDAELIIVGKRAAKALLPVIVTGDLNDVAWSPTTRLFRKISRLLDPRIGRGMFNTFHAGYFFMRWPLDHLFHSHHFTLSEIRRLPQFGSDHFPMLIELALEPERGSAQEGLSADQDDHAWANEKVEQKRDGNSGVGKQNGHCKVPVSGMAWLPDLDSNQGPAD
jgi:endonuclease/exonuclease/phosphatase (EEP) superfamily protein YafD